MRVLPPRHRFHTAFVVLLRQLNPVWSRSFPPNHCGPVSASPVSAHIRGLLHHVLTIDELLSADRRNTSHLVYSQCFLHGFWEWDKTAGLVKKTHFPALTFFHLRCYQKGGRGRRHSEAANRFPTEWTSANSCLLAHPLLFCPRCVGTRAPD